MRGIFGTRFMALMAALLAVAVVAAGCGSDDDGNSGGSSNPQAEVKTVVEESFAFEDPEKVCEENLTDAALEGGYQGEDREARLETCKEDQPAEFHKLEISKVEVKGSTATVTVEAFQSNGRSSKFKIRLLDEDGWKIDRIG